MCFQRVYTCWFCKAETFGDLEECDPMLRLSNYKWNVNSHVIRIIETSDAHMRCGNEDCGALPRRNPIDLEDLLSDIEILSITTSGEVNNLWNDQLILGLREWKPLPKDSVLDMTAWNSNTSALIDQSQTPLQPPPLLGEESAESLFRVMATLLRQMRTGTLDEELASRTIEVSGVHLSYAQFLANTRISPLRSMKAKFPWNEGPAKWRGPALDEHGKPTESHSGALIHMKTPPGWGPWRSDPEARAKHLRALSDVLIDRQERERKAEEEARLHEHAQTQNTTQALVNASDGKKQATTGSSTPQSTILRPAVPDIKFIKTPPSAPRKMLEQSAAQTLASSARRLQNSPSGGQSNPHTPNTIHKVPYRGIAQNPQPASMSQQDRKPPAFFSHPRVAALTTPSRTSMSSNSACVQKEHLTVEQPTHTSPHGKPPDLEIGSTNWTSEAGNEVQRKIDTIVTSAQEANSTGATATDNNQIQKQIDSIVKDNDSDSPEHDVLPFFIPQETVTWPHFGQQPYAVPSYYDQNHAQVNRTNIGNETALDTKMPRFPMPLGPSVIENVTYPSGNTPRVKLPPVLHSSDARPKSVASPSMISGLVHSSQPDASYEDSPGQENTSGPLVPPSRQDENKKDHPAPLRPMSLPPIKTQGLGHPPLTKPAPEALERSHSSKGGSLSANAPVFTPRTIGHNLDGAKFSPAISQEAKAVPNLFKNNGNEGDFKKPDFPRSAVGSQQDASSVVGNTASGPVSQTRSAVNRPASLQILPASHTSAPSSSATYSQQTPLQLFPRVSPISPVEFSYNEFRVPVRPFVREKASPTGDMFNNTSQAGNMYMPTSRPLPSPRRISGGYFHEPIFETPSRDSHHSSHSTFTGSGGAITPTHHRHPIVNPEPSPTRMGITAAGMGMGFGMVGYDGVNSKETTPVDMTAYTPSKFRNAPPQARAAFLQARQDVFEQLATKDSRARGGANGGNITGEAQRNGIGGMGLGQTAKSPTGPPTGFQQPNWDEVRRVSAQRAQGLARMGSQGTIVETGLGLGNGLGR